MMVTRKSIIGKPDMLLIILYLFLVGFGWFSIFSASAQDSGVSLFDFSQRYGKQLVWIALSLFLAFSVLLIDSKFFSTYAYLFYGLMIIVLIGVLLFGSTVAGSRSWFQFGGFAIQPAEFAKFATALALAKYLDSRNTDLRKFNSKFWVAVIIFLPSALILLQNDTGSALVYFAFFLVLFREGLSGWFIFLGFLFGLLFILTIVFGELYITAILIAIVTLMLLFRKKIRKNWKPVIAGLIITIGFIFTVHFAFHKVLEPHQRVRIQVLLGLKKDPLGAGYNVNQSKIAIGSGGFTGKGYFKGMLTRNHFVPEQSTDFIFSTIGEERGFIGSTVLILAFLALLIRIIILAERQRSAFARIYGYGVASILFFHFAINIAMTVGFAPVVGIPLPFFSYGGSSLWAFTILLFIFVKQDASRLSVL